jgi:hypothetical protein
MGLRKTNIDSYTYFILKVSCGSGQVECAKPTLRVSLSFVSMELPYLHSFTTGGGCDFGRQLSNIEAKRNRAIYFACFSETLQIIS